MTGYCLILSSFMILWKAKKQNTVSRSSGEAECRAMAMATCDIVWAVALLKDFGIATKKVVPLYCDNQSAIHICSNPMFHEREKHVEIDCHTLRDKYLEGMTKLLHIRNNLQLTEIFTKPLGITAFRFILDKMNFMSKVHFLFGIGAKYSH